MKFLFLFLAILLTMEPVVSGKRHILQCMGNLGICRASCKKSEQPYLYCRNYQSCCLHSYVRIDISGQEGKNDWSQENRWPKIS
ncbi:beta-defensin 119 [Physeter macrocephalus]|uniref:Beta-defensin 119 n=1 Tax=Physeter macrocephalus TaxID=9755 RepID=A0A2Y9T0X6_PHYMC|nr:beta-defensin 119-like [Physeter catodon]|eukprot:XP_023984023.1 beta-defensin 119-like [Physeter catodon]